MGKSMNNLARSGIPFFVMLIGGIFTLQFFQKAKNEFGKKRAEVDLVSQSLFFKKLKIKFRGGLLLGWAYAQSNLWKNFTKFDLHIYWIIISYHFLKRNIVNRIRIIGRIFEDPEQKRITRNMYGQSWWHKK